MVMIRNYDGYLYIVCVYIYIHCAYMMNILNIMGHYDYASTHTLAHLHKLSTKVFIESRCNRLRCPLARMSGLQCFNMGHNGHGINLYGVSMTLMAN